MRNPEEEIKRDQYVATVLALYLNLPETSDRVSRYDRIRAVELYERGINLSVVEMAFLLASFRRLTRPEESPPLSPIRSLAYFLPVIEELVENPPPMEYLQYLRTKASW